MSEIQKQNTVAVTISHLQSLKTAEIANDDKVAAMFVKNYNAVHNTESGLQAYELEKYYFNRIVSQNKALKNCTHLSLYACFIEMAVLGMSFDPNKKLCYLVPQNVNIGTKDNPMWETRCALEISPYGELAERQKMGQIKHADNPEVVYQDEKFVVTQTPSGKAIQHEFSYPRAGKVIAVYMRIVKLDGTTDYSIIDAAEMKRLAIYSDKKNKGNGDLSNANPLYKSNNGDPDLGFWKAKCIKHAFKSYPKVKVPGQHIVLATDRIEEEPTPGIDYGMPITEHEELPPINTTSQETTQMTMPPAQEEKGEPVVIDTDDPGF